jgi:L-seryl-tRNA(Ser) seleniumtransferase
MKQSQLRAIPAVERILQALADLGLPRPMVVEVVRRELAALRKQKSIPVFDAVVAAIQSTLRALASSRIRPLINGTGIVIHTNFGRAPLGEPVIDAISRVGANYNNLEYGLAGGKRGGRAAYLEQSLAVLCGSEAATVVNNNAAALVLILRHFCDVGEGARGAPSVHRKNEVIISRGELLQIGGGFRIPDILETSGARLREVGTTNKTTLRDYAQAIGRETAMILKVHRSNFFMEGFVESPAPEEIGELARQKRVPFVEDLGSGAMIETGDTDGLEHEPTPSEVIRRGVDLVCFSGDKLLGGPQAGIIAGKAKFMDALKRDPFFRALRCDKLILAGLEATADIYMRGEARIPVIEMIRATTGELKQRAETILDAIEGLPVRATIGTGQAQIGGGTMPRSAIESVTLDLIHRALPPQQLAARLRDLPVPVVGYVARGAVRLDLRTIFRHQDEELIGAIRTVCIQS